MARRENPVPPCSRSLLALVTWLRSARDTAGLTYRQLAARTEYSADTLARAASGRSVPQNLTVVLAYAAACGLSKKEAERLWKHARRDEARTQSVLSGHRSGVHISVVKDFADLHGAIVDLHHDDGRPPLRSLDARLGGLGRLPHSTVGRVLKGSSTPTRTFVAAFAEACNVRRSELPEWTKAWDRADADRRSSRLRSRRRPAAQQSWTVHDRVTPRDLQLLMSELESTARKEPALKILVHVPDPSTADEEAAARMSRELLIDQAQRRGELACPQCRRPSFGYDDGQGWVPQLCSSCAPAPGLRGSAPSGPGPGAPPRDPHALAATTPPAPAVDTPTLSLRVPGPGGRPPLPRRTSRAWPRPAAPPSAPPLNGDWMAPRGEPAALQVYTPTHLVPLKKGLPPKPSLAPEVCALGAACPVHGEGGGSPGRQPEVQCFPTATLTTRVRINIPGSRPIPPIVMRALPEPVPGRPAPSASPITSPLDTTGPTEKESCGPAAQNDS
ncbi:helix-turn-helix domain-containing protein [Streptomyces sp. f51]|uniref:helix-turn-helix domain-containing protein n=1 Tax=Streptomyces sp. f51 TaxID=1827742 RepID=UPI000BF24278|nr:helix-turn-helix transcriptional regulator [Streptomyces sp. f51]